MKKFAKLFEHQELGQILVKLDTNDEDDKPEIRFFFTAPDYGMGSVALIFSDAHDDWEKAQTAFEAVGEQQAIEVVAKALADIHVVFGEMKS